MRTLSIDIETFSSANIAKGGAYKYAAADDFEILLFAYSVDDSPVTVVSIATGETVPADIISALMDPSVTKYAFNAQFERVCLSRWLQQQSLLPKEEFIDPGGWRCTMVWCASIGLPMSLDQAAKVLSLKAQKISEGKSLIQYFCLPTKPREVAAPVLFDASGMTHRNHPQTAPERWVDFIEYNRRDVETEQEMRTKLERFPLPDWVWDQYATDQRINDNGIRIDLDLAAHAITVDDVYREHCVDEAQELTGLENPGSPTQLQNWLNVNGCPIESMAKEHVQAALKTATGSTRRVLELRQDMSRSSVKKYQAMQQCAIPATSRAHGLLQFYGAGRTGRWAGRLVQVQNLPRNYIQDLAGARELIRGEHHNLLELLFDSVPDTLSQLIRTAFIPAEGKKFIVADYSAIEARVLAWLAGQDTTIQAFVDGKDLYCATAAQMFGVPVEKNGQNADLRQKGKIAVLACGYQGGVGAIKTMGGEQLGFTEDEMRTIVDKWRSANRKIVAYWYAIDEAAKHTITTGEPSTVRSITMRIDGGMLLITLPSGRSLVYPKAGIGINRFGNDTITFHGVGINRKFVKQETYGGKLVENITQAVARDLLAHALTTLEKAGHAIVMHIHDEAVIEADATTPVDVVCRLMEQAPEWASGIPLTADGYECPFYQKD
ncbi:DNA polymerase bacteriophage-type [Corynebacterium ulcerans 809]|uniref:DNA polymerase n=1 Tax=Corynebacterium ulcerans TaxID=65058 RepID=UPI0002185441|nr:DNA polymerase [Corynebacterium ulcerans]AEG81707.1 DNA polymerase bacteriophage-type [Corynebacterium ulcerans 809]